MLSITVEALTSDGGDEIHLHAAGQGVWVRGWRPSSAPSPILCGFIGGETGAVLRPLLERMDVELRLVETGAASGCYLHDRRSGERDADRPERLDCRPRRHEIDELFSSTVAAAIDRGVLALCGPYPARRCRWRSTATWSPTCRANGTPVVVDLSPPRLDSALEGGPDLVKINDWELASYIDGPGRHAGADARGGASGCSTPAPGP